MGEHYDTVEHFLGIWKARFYKDTDVERKIWAEADTVKVKRLHRQIKWNGNISHYTRIMWELIYTASRHKYVQDKNLRLKLFKTAGLLVETTQGRSQWGCGRAHDDARANQRDSWGYGCLNLNGDLQTLLRHELSSEFGEEYIGVVNESVAHYTRQGKRPLDNVSPENCKRRNSLCNE